MLNEEIITGLKNAVERGESLEQATQIMIGSGYDQREVEEASRFVWGGVLKNLEQPGPGEQLVMPEQKKGIFSKLKFWKKEQFPQPLAQAPVQPPIQQAQPAQQIPSQPAQQLPQPSPPPQKIQIRKEPLAEQLKKIRPRKPKHLREIILIIILLILLIILAVTVFFKGTIFGWFS